MGFVIGRVAPKAVRLPKEFRFERELWISPDFDEPLPPDILRGFRAGEP